MRIRVGVILAVILFALGARGGDRSIFDDMDLPPSKGQPTPTPPSVHPAPATQPAPVPPPTVVTPDVPKATPTAPSSAPSISDDSPPQKSAPPDAPSKAKILKMLKDIYQKEYADRTPTARRALAGELLAEADKIKTNFAAQYVLLEEAETCGMQAGDVPIVQKAIGGLDRSFTVDTGAMTADAMTRISNAGINDAAFSSWALDAAEQRIGADDYAGAQHILRIATSRITRNHDPMEMARLKANEATLSEFERARPAREKLKTDPNDAAANFIVGRFFCFYKGDWDKGLPLLAKGNDAKLKTAASHDVLNPASPADQLAVATLWYEIAEDRTRIAYQMGSHLRAAKWYEKSLPDLNGLDKTLAQKRLDQCRVAIGPREVVKQLVIDPRSKAGFVFEGLQCTGPPLKTPEELTAPCRIDVIAMTDASGIHITYGKGFITLLSRMQPYKEFDIWHADPLGLTSVVTPVENTVMPMKKMIHITWTIESSMATVTVDGVQRGTTPGDYAGVHGYLGIGGSNNSTITVKSVKITTLPHN